MANRRLVLSLYRGILRTAREGDDNLLLMQELLRRPVDLIQAASAGVDVDALNVRVLFENGNPPEIAGEERSLPRRHVVLLEGAGGDAAEPQPAVEPGPVVAMHPEYTPNICGGELFWDATVTITNPIDGSMKLDFSDGDFCTWSADDARSNVHRKRFILEAMERGSSKLVGAPVLAVGGFYLTRSTANTSFPKWYRASLLDSRSPRRDADAPAWSLVGFCRAAFRQQGLDEGAVAAAAASRLAFDKESGASLWGGSDNGAGSVTEATGKGGAGDTALDKAFEVLMAAGVAESAVRTATMGQAMGSAQKLSATHADHPARASPEERSSRRRRRWAAAPRAPLDDLRVPAKSPLSSMRDRAEVLAANGAFFAALEAQSMPLMREVWARGVEEPEEEGGGRAEPDEGALPLPEPSCIHPGYPVQRGWESIEEFWASAFQRHPKGGRVVVGGGVGGGGGGGGGGSGRGMRGASGGAATDGTLKLELDDVAVTLDSATSARVTLTARVSRSGRTSAMATTNLFVRRSPAHRYRLVHHHSSMLLPGHA